VGQVFNLPQKVGQISNLPMLLGISLVPDRTPMKSAISLHRQSIPLSQG
jgi:hypothetical protein